MGRAYAGILGPLAMTVLIVRGLRAGSGIESTAIAAVVGMLAFALVGAALGALAEWVVEDSVRNQVALEVASQETRTASPRPARS